MNSPDYSRSIFINGLDYRMVPYGYCVCGCGQKTPKAKYTWAPYRSVKGMHRRFIQGHHFRGVCNVRYSGGKMKSEGYLYTFDPSHPRASCNGYVPDSVIVAESAIGKYLPKGAVVHHVDGDRKNNSNSNLVVCENEDYHKLIEKRARAYKACGHANWLKCPYCGKYDDPKNMYLFYTNRSTTPSGRHNKCLVEYKRNRKYGRSN